MLKQLSVNIFLFEALEQIPGYAKYLKDLVMKKMIVSFGPADNLYHYSAITLYSLVEKKS